MEATAICRRFKIATLLLALSPEERKEVVRETTYLGVMIAIQELKRRKESDPNPVRLTPSL